MKGKCAKNALKVRDASWDNNRVKTHGPIHRVLCSDPVVFKDNPDMKV
jgi:hypothetical protein